MSNVITAVLSGRTPKPQHDGEGKVVGWRCHAHDHFKRVFHVTPEQGDVILPLMEAGGGQEILLRYGPSSTLAVLAGAVDPELRAAIARAAPTTRGRHEPLEERARTIFDATPSRHPSGRLPDWDFQPESVKNVFRGFAARLPRDLHNGRTDLDEYPQHGLRGVAGSLWNRDRRLAGLAASNALWAASSALDLDPDAYSLLKDEWARRAEALASTCSGSSILLSDEEQILKACAARLQDILRRCASQQAQAPFAIALELVEYTLRISSGA